MNNQLAIEILQNRRDELIKERERTRVDIGKRFWR